MPPESILAGQSSTNTGGASQGGGQAGSAGTGAANTAGSGQGSHLNAVPSWRDTLPDELKADPSITKFNDMKDLASSYIHLQKTLGSDKIPVPNKNSSAEEWQGVFKKLGLPESVDKYELKTPEGFKGDENFLKAFKEQALKTGVLPQQAEKLLEWYHGVDSQGQKVQLEQRQAAQQKGIETLKAEWGEGWDQKVNAANTAVERFMNEEEIKYMRDSGRGNDPFFIRMMARWGETLGEGKIRGEGTGKITGSTPQEAQAKINSILSDFNHPYHNGAHADHKRAVEEMSSLFQAIHGRS